MKIVTERSSNPNSIIDAILTEIIPEPINVNPFGLMQMLEVIKLRDDEFVLEGFFGFVSNLQLPLILKLNNVHIA